MRPSCCNLINVVATASKQLFTMRQLHVSGPLLASFCMQHTKCGCYEPSYWLRDR